MCKIFIGMITFIVNFAQEQYEGAHNKRHRMGVTPWLEEPHHSDSTEVGSSILGLTFGIPKHKLLPPDMFSHFVAWCHHQSRRPPPPVGDNAKGPKPTPAKPAAKVRFAVDVEAHAGPTAEPTKQDQRAPIKIVGRRAWSPGIYQALRLQGKA